MDTLGHTKRFKWGYVASELYGLAVITPLGLALANPPLSISWDTAAAIDAYLIGVPLCLSVCWVAFFGFLSMTVRVISKAWADGQRS